MVGSGNAGEEVVENGWPGRLIIERHQRELHGTAVAVRFSIGNYAYSAASAWCGGWRGRFTAALMAWASRR